MKIVADLSLYPLKDAPIPDIIDFIHDLEACDGIEVVSNQLATQVRGEFSAVTGAVNRCMEKVMTKPDTAVLVVKYLNVDVELKQAPSLTPDA